MSDVNMHTCEKQPLGRLRAVEIPCGECQREANAREFNETLTARFRALNATPERVKELESQLADARQALEQWPCPKCHGGVIRVPPRDSIHTLPPLSEYVPAPCPACGGTGLHPIARAALAGENAQLLKALRDSGTWFEFE